MSAWFDYKWRECCEDRSHAGWSRYQLLWWPIISIQLKHNHQTKSLRTPPHNTFSSWSLDHNFISLMKIFDGNENILNHCCPFDIYLFILSWNDKTHWISTSYLNLKQPPAQVKYLSTRILQEMVSLFWAHLKQIINYWVPLPIIILGINWVVEKINIPSQKSWNLWNLSFKFQTKKPKK